MLVDCDSGTDNPNNSASLRTVYVFINSAEVGKQLHIVAVPTRSRVATEISS